MYVRGDMELTVPDAGNFPLMATTLEALRGPLFGEGDLGPLASARVSAPGVSFLGGWCSGWRRLSWPLPLSGGCGERRLGHVLRDPSVQVLGELWFLAGGGAGTGCN